jgi:hypothetical protein
MDIMRSRTYFEDLLSMEPWAAEKKTIKLVWGYNQLLFGFLANGHLPRVSCQLRLSANDKNDNEIPGYAHLLAPEETPENLN